MIKHSKKIKKNKKSRGKKTLKGGVRNAGVVGSLANDEATLRNLLSQPYRRSIDSTPKTLKGLIDLCTELDKAIKIKFPEFPDHMKLTTILNGTIILNLGNRDANKLEKYNNFALTPDKMQRITKILKYIKGKDYSRIKLKFRTDEIYDKKIRDSFLSGYQEFQKKHFLLEHGQYRLHTRIHYRIQSPIVIKGPNINIDINCYLHYLLGDVVPFFECEVQEERNFDLGKEYVAIKHLLFYDDLDQDDIVRILNNLGCFEINTKKTHIKVQTAKKTLQRYIRNVRQGQRITDELNPRSIVLSDIIEYRNKSKEYIKEATEYINELKIYPQDDVIRSELSSLLIKIYGMLIEIDKKYQVFFIKSSTTKEKTIKDYLKQIESLLNLEYLKEIYMIGIYKYYETSPDYYYDFIDDLMNKNSENAKKMRIHR